MRLRFFVLLVAITFALSLEKKNQQLRRTNGVLLQALRELTSSNEAQAESAVGGADGTGQWNSHRPYGGVGDIFCGREWCGKYTDCTAARTELKADKDVGDLSGCPSGFVTYKATACEKKNFWGTRQYLRECQEEGLAEESVGFYGTYKCLARNDCISSCQDEDSSKSRYECMKECPKSLCDKDAESESMDPEDEEDDDSEEEAGVERGEHLYQWDMIGYDDQFPEEEAGRWFGYTDDD